MAPAMRLVLALVIALAYGARAVWPPVCTMSRALLEGSVADFLGACGI
jgi:hypothetical protein